MPVAAMVTAEQAKLGGRTLGHDTNAMVDRVLTALDSEVMKGTSVDAQVGGLKRLGTKIKAGAVGGVIGVVKGARGKGSSEKGAPSAPDSDGIVYEKAADAPKPPAAAAADAPKPPAAAVTIDQIIQMVGAKLPDDLIITTIRNSGSTFDLNPDILIRLKTAGVSDAVLRSMSR